MEGEAAVGGVEVRENRPDAALLKSPTLETGESVSITVKPSPNNSSEEVTGEVLNLWMRRARRKFLRGVTVIKITPTGKLVKRGLFIGAKPEYLELISTKLFNTAHHLSDIQTVVQGHASPDFAAFRRLEPNRMPKAEKSLVIHAGDSIISVVFMSVADRMDAQMLIEVERELALAAFRDQAVVTTDRGPSTSDEIVNNTE